MSLLQLMDSLARRQGMRVIMTCETALMVFAFSLPAGDLPAQTPSLSELLRKSTQAQGGTDNLAAIRSIRLTGRVILPPIDEGGGGAPRVATPSLPVIVLVKPPGLVRMEIDTGRGIMLAISDGASFWFKDSDAASFREMSENGLGALMAGLLNGMSEISRPLSFAESEDRIELVGIEVEEGNEVYKLRAARNSDSVYFFLDRQNFLKVKQSEIFRDLDLDTYYGDFRAVGTVILPYRLEHRAVNNQTFSRMVAEKIELNLEIDDSYFKVP